MQERTVFSEADLVRSGGGGREGGRGGEGDLIEPPKYKQLTSKSGLEVFPPAPI